MLKNNNHFHRRKKNERKKSSMFVNNKKQKNNLAYSDIKLSYSLKHQDQSQTQYNTLIPRLNYLNKIQYTYFIQKGNNHQLIKKIMQKRSWWIQGHLTNFNFRWKPTSMGINFLQLGSNGLLKRQIVNHLERHQQISTKSNLYFNMRSQCSLLNQDVEQFLPKTYVINIDSNRHMQQLNQFIQLFHMIQNNTNLKNVWMFKPNSMNQGRGISLFNSLQKFKLLLWNYTFDQTKQKLAKITGNLIQEIKAAIGPKNKPTRRQRHIIIQKYIEKPLLINNRKFDIRIWVMVDHQGQYYIFKQNYIRLSSETYELTQKGLNNLFIHLTNNAIQKHSHMYSRFEEGNQILLKTLKVTLGQQKYATIIKYIKNIIKISMNSVKNKIGQRRFTFQIFGYDFLLDSALNVYLLQINSNPSLDLSSSVTNMLIPRMISIFFQIDDTFRITIDKIFPALYNMKSQLLVLDYPVQNYSRYQNLWQYLGSIF